MDARTLATLVSMTRFVVHARACEVAQIHGFQLTSPHASDGHSSTLTKETGGRIFGHRFLVRSSPLIVGEDARRFELICPSRQNAR